jgi:hypothetical protein
LVFVGGCKLTDDDLQTGMAHPATPTPHINWEYRSIAISAGSSPNAAVLNELGKEGWYLVCFDTSGAVWFRRRLP